MGKWYTVDQSQNTRSQVITRALDRVETANTDAAAYY